LLKKRPVHHQDWHAMCRQVLMTGKASQFPTCCGTGQLDRSFPKGEVHLARPYASVQAELAQAERMRASVSVCGQLRRQAVKRAILLSNSFESRGAATTAPGSVNREDVTGGRAIWCYLLSDPIDERRGELYSSCAKPNERKQKHATPQK
jgi:hypothetical protein